MSKDKVESVLGVDLYKDFCEVKDQLQPNTSSMGFLTSVYSRMSFWPKKMFRKVL